MQVKCPKCRFRYDVPVTPGAKELACVCQRCGTPFTYVMSEEEQESVHQQANAPVGDIVGSLQHKSSNAQQSTSSPMGGGQEGAYQRPSANTQQPTTSNQRPTSNPYRTNYGSGQGGVVMPPRRKNGCMRNCFVIFLVLLTIAVFAVRMCISDRSYTSDDLDEETEIVDNELISSNGRDQVEVKEGPDPFASDKAPKWLQGNWSVTTPHGVITTTIRGKHIVETSNGQSSHGTFYYKRGELRCDFGDGEESVRKVDESKQRIDAGEGAWMHKTDFSDER
ncbi:MAG: hypothetical protein IKW98_06100 [Prevotella sp.]|nr:hypothetical protein [Prevotella sp.]